MLLARPGAIRNNQHLQKFLGGSPLPESFQTGAPKKPKKPEKKKSRAEQEMEQILEAQLRRGEIAEFGFEKIVLIVGSDLCRYTPDFHVILRDGRLRFIEVKGGKKWEDSIIKYKCAKHQFPHFEFQMWELTDTWKQLY
jgi:hypothetical protein